MNRKNFTNRLFLACVAAAALTLLLPGCAARTDVVGPEDARSGAPSAVEQDSHNGHLGVAEVPAERAESVDVPLDAPTDDVVAAEPVEESVAEPAEESVAEPAEDPTLLVAEGLDACESARIFWEQGDMEEALASLDHAYSLLLQIPVEVDPDLEQGKADLRHLISRRVVEIYRSRLTSAVDPGSPIPLELNAHVEREIKLFQNGERKFFLDSYRRSGQYRPMIVRMLREAGLPEELSWLPLVESGFKTRALSRARALGMWQFISSTGYRYGLSRSHWIDERMDPEESTRGAIAYLTELHGMFGDWMTALAGYNCGEHRVMQVIRRQKSDYMDHFWDVFEQLPRETARYVPRFLATLMIVKDPARYGFELPEPLPPVGYDSVVVGRHVKLEDLDGVLELEKGALAALNPELRQGVTPGESYELNVPPAAAPAFAAKLAELPEYVPPKDAYVVHRVRSGQTLSTIARRYGSSVNAIVLANNLRSKHRIRVGQRLKIPARGARTSPAPAVAYTGEAASLTHRVRRGDSLWKLASRYGTTVDRIKRDNGLRGDRLHVGQNLRINTGPPAGSRTYAVRKGDTVGKIAKRHRVSTTEVLRANGLSSSSTIYPGQVLVIP